MPLAEVLAILMEIAQAYVAEREGFGVKLGDRESVQIKLGEVAQQIQIGRLLTMHDSLLTPYRNVLSHSETRNFNLLTPET